MTTIASPGVQAQPTCGGTPADWQDTDGIGATYSGEIEDWHGNPFGVVEINLNAGKATMTAEPDSPTLDEVKNGSLVFQPDDREKAVEWTGPNVEDRVTATLGYPSCSYGSNVATASFMVAPAENPSIDRVYKGEVHRHY
ncbi:hypothetical protein [Nocardia sp. NPDC019395]|uniref:hypothetical protein n=1 Tax=Nocardia sp. NPDC019395 TaxID=3154686 RepID=UPI0033DBAE85